MHSQCAAAQDFGDIDAITIPLVVVAVGSLSVTIGKGTFPEIASCTLRWEYRTDFWAKSGDE